MNTNTALVSPPQSLLQRLWRPIEMKMTYDQSVLLMLVLAAAGVLTAGYLLTRLFRK